MTAARIIPAVLAATIIPTILFGVMGGVSAALMAFTFALPWVLCISLPALLVLRHLNLIRWWSAAIAGFVGAAVPAAVYMWPYGNSGSSYSAWDGEKTTLLIANGDPTKAGWLQYIYDAIGFGALGAICAVAFWVVWRASATSRDLGQ